MPRRSRRGATAALVLVASGALLAGCGGGGTGAAPRADLPTQGPTPWNPCDGVDVKQLGTFFDTAFTVSTGTPDAPECRFIPTVPGRPAIDANYSLVPGTIGELISTFGDSPNARVTKPVVAKSDGARIIIHAGKDILAISGFVKNGDLVQSVNVVTPRAFHRRAALIEGTRRLLTALSVHAADSGLTSGTRSATSGAPGPSGSPGTPGTPGSPGSAATSPP